MGFFKKIFGQSPLFQNEPNIVFGRFTDAYKSPAQYAHWDESIVSFENENYFEAYRSFLKYLDAEGNLTWAEENGEITFSLFQGSKVVQGFINQELIKAEAKIAVSSALNVGFLRRMIELNYNLKYSRYALDQNDDLTLVFDSYLIDGSPYKLYHALKEIAVNADKQDDLLVNEFDSLKEINTGHLIDLETAEKQAKVTYLKSEIRRVLAFVDSLQSKGDKFSGGIMYLLLNLSYKLDYLIKPEGKTMDTFERIHRTFFAKNNKSSVEKGGLVKKEFEQILELTDADIEAELYKTISSFGIVNPTNHNQFVGFVDGELPNMDWYVENKHPEVAMAIPGYIVGYCLFNYALPKPDKEFLHLYHRIFEPIYFSSLGYEHIFINAEKQTFNEKLIIKAINELVTQNEPEFPNLKPETSKLDFKTPTSFAKSYLTMLRDMDVSKKDVLV